MYYIINNMSSQKNLSELTQSERDDIFEKLKCEVKVKLLNRGVFAFTPFKQYASIPPQYYIKWLPLYVNENPKSHFMFCHDVFHMINTEGIESDNIDYLNEAMFQTKNMKLNLNLENEQIWSMLTNTKNVRDLEDSDEDFKERIIKGYKICKEKTYNFKTIAEEEAYFTRDDITAEEEVYYYTFVVKWCEVTP